VADKEAKKFTTVWPTDDEWLKLNDDELEKINLTHIHYNEGVNVESLTFQLNNKFGTMQHPAENNYVKKLPREIDGRHIRKIEMVARKNKQMIASIKFLDAENKVVCSFQGSKNDGEKFTLELGETEYIVGCRQYNNASLRDIEFRILDKGKLNVNDLSTMSSINFGNTSGIKNSAF
jgi:hypothetical protein